MNSPENFYTTQIQRLNDDIRHLKGRSHWLMTGEIVSFVAVIGCVVGYTLLPSTAWWIAALVLFATYIYIRRLDARNDRSIMWLNNLRLAYSHEVDALHGNFEAFDAGNRFKDAHHPFTLDLDIFGSDSLFQRMSRCATDEGAQSLASYLSFGKFRDLRRGIESLQGSPEWMMSFVAHGIEGPVKGALLAQTLKHLSMLPLPRWIACKASLIIAVLLLSGFLCTVLLALFGVIGSTIPVWWAILQFFLAYGYTSKSFKKIHASVDEGLAYTQRLGALMRHVCSLSTAPEGYENEMKSVREAMGCIESMAQLQQKLDSRGNILGLFLMDSLFLSDFFLMRSYAKWMSQNLSHVDEWMQAVGEIDALVSVALFRLDHPEAVYAEISDEDGVHYEAEGLYHPFLGKQAVSNDFTINDRQYYIITGANMAGKSTFLRSIGINYVLGLNGMPVFARSLRISRFSLFTSMRTTDDLTHGVSYFNAELLRLSQLIDYCKVSGRRTLIILDEILKGTNSLDKLNGSRLFLEYISQEAVSGVIATHDLELSKMEDAHPDRFHNYCFEIQLDTRVTYSYKITRGVARNQNATFLLRSILKR